MDGEAWWAAVYGIAQSRTRLSAFTFTFHSDALEKEMATHSSVLAWRVPGSREPGGLPSMGSHRVGHDWGDWVAAAAALCWCNSSQSFLFFTSSKHDQNCRETSTFRETVSKKSCNSQRQRGNSTFLSIENSSRINPFKKLWLNPSSIIQFKL